MTKNISLDDLGIIEARVKTLAGGEKNISTRKPIKVKKRFPEADLQAMCVKWFRLAYPQYQKLLFSIPNGAVTSGLQRKFLTAQGLVPGVSDLMLAVGRKGFLGHFIEMKIAPNKLSDYQVEFTEAIIAQGYNFSVCYTFEQFEKSIKFYLG